MRLPESFKNVEIFKVVVIFLEVNVIRITKHYVNENRRFDDLGLESSQAIKLFFFGKYSFLLIRLVSSFK